MNNYESMKMVRLTAITHLVFCLFLMIALAIICVELVSLILNSVEFPLQFYFPLFMCLFFLMFIVYCFVEGYKYVKWLKIDNKQKLRKEEIV